MLNQEIAFNSLQFGTELPSDKQIVDILIAGSSISEIVGPTPLVDITRSFQNDDGYLSTIVETINLNGKIVTSGIKNVVSKIEELEKLLSCSSTSIEIQCDSEIIYARSGIIVKSLNFNKTDNNWIRTADFSIDLESKIDASGNLKTVENQSETWSIDPIEDDQFIGSSYQTRIGQEYLNPNSIPPANRNSPSPQGNANGSSIGQSTIGIKNYGKYRITRRLSAKGIAVPKKSADVECLSLDRNTANKIRVINAKEWVDEAASAIDKPASGSIYFASLGLSAVSSSTGQGMHLYNHIRSTSTDFFNGSYEMTDTWTAMPVGSTHTESFTIDCSTAENFTKTVRVIGNVNGMSLYKHNAINHLSNPNGTNNELPKQSLTVDNNLGANNTNKSVNISGGSQISSLTTNQTNTDVNNISDDKYTNAKKAWEELIKPYLYRRACLAMSANEGRQNRLPNNEVDPTKPESPAFFNERVLGSIPVNTSEGHDPYKGIISYTYEFNNKYRSIPGVISESINVIHELPSDSVVEVPVLGRQLGPILYSYGKTPARKTLTIDIVVQPPQSVAGSLPNNSLCPIGLGTDLRNYIDKIVEGHTPFYPADVAIFGSQSVNNTTGQRISNDTSALPGTVFVKGNNETWNPTEGRFSKTVSWTYQNCNLVGNALDY